MPYREVTMFEVKEVLRVWMVEVPTQRIARTRAIDRKTVRRYVVWPSSTGSSRDSGPRR